MNWLARLSVCFLLLAVGLPCRADPRPENPKASGAVVSTTNVPTLDVANAPGVNTPDPATGAEAGSVTRVRVSDPYGQLPFHFEANRGQTDPQVKFLSRSPKHTLFLAPTEAVLVFTRPEWPGKGEGHDPKARLEKLQKATRTALRMKFMGANPDVQLAGREELPGKANYFIGNDPSKWRPNVPTYAKVHYEDLYPGIDLVYYGNQRQLEYDFVVRPGTDPNRIVLGFQGADRLEVDAQGDLVLRTPAGALRQRKPVIYQEVDGVRREIAGGYVLKGADQVGFRVAAYDASRPLVIDPVLFYSTYLGGSGDDNGTSIAVDGVGNAYVAGNTNSINFPTTAGSFETSFVGGPDVFVTKLNPTGSGLVYSTYLGGSGGEDVRDSGLIAVDAAGNAYVAGATSSSDFPTTPGAFQPALSGGGDAFVTKLNPLGNGLVYSTYLGGNAALGPNGDDGAFGIAVDAAGSAYVAGATNSGNFPTTPGAFQTSRGSAFQVAFVTKLNPAGTGLIYSTYLGGATGNVIGLPDIAVDASGNAYVTAITNSPNFPTTLGSFQPAYGGGSSDSSVTKLNPAGTGLVYSTYLGGSDGDGGGSIVVDASGNAYVSGSTRSPNFPTTLGAFQTALAGPFDAFVTKLNPFGTGLVYSTLLGGSGGDQGFSIALDNMGNAYVTGDTSSADFPTTPSAFQTAFSGGPNDAFVTKLNPFGTGLVYSTYLGGSGDDHVIGIALDALPNPNAYVTGVTQSTDFPTTAGAFQSTFGGGSSDAFVAKISEAPPVIVSNMFLHGSGGTANPPTLTLDDTAPTATAAKYKDSGLVSFSGGNSWREIGIWSALPEETDGSLVALSDLHVWLGLKNSDDQGTSFDLRAEVYKNNELVASRLTRCVAGITRNPSNAKEVTVSFDPFAPADFDGATDVIRLRVLTRIGTNPDDTKCPGHNNATGLRLYFDAVNRASQFGAVAP